jgi:type VI secretion system secreted protein Hcp
MAAVDYFLKFEGVDAESQDHKHKGSIQIESWSWGETNAGSAGHGTGSGSGKVAMQDVHFTAKVHKGSPILSLKCASGEHIKKAILTCRKAGKDQQEFLKFSFEDVLVTSFQIGGSAHGDIVPVEQVSFAFAQIEMEYKEQKQDGTLGGPVKAGWNLMTNKAK